MGRVRDGEARRERPRAQARSIREDLFVGLKPYAPTAPAPSLYGLRIAGWRKLTCQLYSLAGQWVRPICLLTCEFAEVFRGIILARAIRDEESDALRVTTNFA